MFYYYYLGTFTAQLTHKLIDIYSGKLDARNHLYAKSKTVAKTRRMVTCALYRTRPYKLHK